MNEHVGRSPRHTCRTQPARWPSSAPVPCGTTGRRFVARVPAPRIVTDVGALLVRLAVYTIASAYGH